MPRKKNSKPSRHQAAKKSRSHGRGKSGATKVGDSASAARKVGGKGDFGVPESDPIERAYASAAVRRQDKGGAVAHSMGQGKRSSGVGGNESGVGSSSGGDVDTDIIGVGTGGSTVSASGMIEEPPGPDDSTGKSDEFASPPPKAKAGKIIPRKGGRHGRSAQAKIRGGTVDRSGGDISTTRSGQGTAAVTNPMARNDDSFSAEISNDEAAGADNSPSDNK